MLQEKDLRRRRKCVKMLNILLLQLLTGVKLCKLWEVKLGLLANPLLVDVDVDVSISAEQEAVELSMVGPTQLFNDQE